ncbi:pe38 [Catopsilia pomona nucleopolyhedrovirus]|uniref:Pe38 n=1 Tax=Catopsilia pomona nucleopolyhedrovirus TaxID=1850906 RepID=A0A172WZ77_9ABAC|nr:pe38 [Catopsilia pomona nucleopolyhedrovirus]ANF29654.1 pe38 [Catopsilia pomona nucleopolyhedrovirus]
MMSNNQNNDGVVAGGSNIAELLMSRRRGNGSSGGRNARIHPYARLPRPTDVVQRYNLPTQKLKNDQERPIFTKETAKFECSVCFEKFIEVHGENTVFFTPKSCTHPICGKCVVNIHGSTTNNNNKRVQCPSCNGDILSWLTYTRNSIVECKFVKKQSTIGNAWTAYNNHWKLLKERYEADEDNDNEDDNDAAAAFNNWRSSNSYYETKIELLENNEINMENRMHEAENSESKAYDAYCLARQQFEQSENEHAETRRNLDAATELNNITQSNMQKQQQKIDGLERELNRINRVLIEYKDQNVKQNNFIVELKNLQANTERKYNDKTKECADVYRLLAELQNANKQLHNDYEAMRAAQPLLQRFNVKHHKQFETLMQSQILDLLKKFNHELIDKSKNVQQTVYGSISGVFYAPIPNDENNSNYDDYQL